MLLMMAWVFWYFCAEEKKKDEEVSHCGRVVTDGAKVLDKPSDLESLPYTNEALEHNILQSHFHAMMWNSISVSPPDVADPFLSGSEKDSQTKTLIPVVLPEGVEMVQEEVLKTTQCNCSDIDSSRVNRISDERSSKDIIVENTTTQLSNDNKSINKETVEENIEISYINLDESENYDNFPMGENIIPTTITFEQHGNYDLNDFDDENIDYEVSSAFMAVNEEEVMKASLLTNRMNSLESYQRRVGNVGSSSSTKLSIHTNSSINDTAAGRIHSIVVPKDAENHDLRIRSTSPLICIHPGHSIHYGHEGYEGFINEEIHPVAEDITLANIGSDPDKEGTQEDVNQLSGVTSSLKEIDTKLNPGKLKESTPHKRVEMSSTSPSAKLTDFDTVMKSRKLHTDTMDITANVLGNLGHRKEKILGTTRKMSKNWARLQEAVLKRQFFSFKDVPLSTNSSE